MNWKLKSNGTNRIVAGATSSEAFLVVVTMVILLGPFPLPRSLTSLHSLLRAATNLRTSQWLD